MKEQYDLHTIESIKDILIQNKKTLSVAESVTSGHLQVACALATEASKYFQGGITTYNAGQKVRHLNVEPIFALQCNCVDLNVAEEMAIHCNQLFLSQYAIGITGYATKVPEEGINELKAYIAVANGMNILIRKKIIPPAESKDSYIIQLFYTNEAIKILYEAIKSL